MCPHCGTRCDTVRTRQVTSLYREVVYRCRNADCEYLFIAGITPIREIWPSKCPNPEILIPSGLVPTRTPSRA
ncbi:ogr/Delta-like zinc finger family protein [Azospirillum melinis]